MAKCIECGDEFVPTHVQMTCPECIDMQDDATQEIMDYVDDDVDEIQENEDFANDNDYGDAPEDRYLDSYWEDRNEISDYESDYFGGDF